MNTVLGMYIIIPIMKEWSNKYFSYTIGDYIVEKNSEKIESPLLKFLKSEMKMQANYQPIVIKMLLEVEDSDFTVSIKQIREKFDETYFYRNFNVNPENLDHLEYTQTPSGVDLLIVEGSLISLDS